MSKKQRKAIAFIVFLCVLFFVVGGIFAASGVFPLQIYALISGLAGSLASTLGLLAFLSPRLTADDVRGVEAQLIEQLSEATSSLNAYENKIQKSKEEIDQLERLRKDIEVVVRQTSLKFYLEEKIKTLSDEIEEKIEENNHILNLLHAYQETKEKLNQIDGEIAGSPHAELVLNIIGKIEQKDLRLVVNIGKNTSIDLTPIAQIVDVYVHILRRILH